MVPHVADQDVRQRANRHRVAAGLAPARPFRVSQAAKHINIGAADRIELADQVRQRRTIEIRRADVHVLVEAGQRRRIAAPVPP